MSTELQRVIDHENAYWSDIFNKELSKRTFKKYSSYWWQDYYEELTRFIDGYVSKRGYSNALEAGCGSGKATILLGGDISKSLLDISDSALSYSRYLAEKLSVSGVKFIRGDIFNLPFKEKCFDFVWNIGVIEHYEPDQIELILREMIRVCANKGSVAVAFPNQFSGPIWKAWLLSRIKILPGYKLDTEKFYPIEKITKLITAQAEAEGREIARIDVARFGSPLFMESPAWLIILFKKIASRNHGSNKFLIMLICEFK